MRGLPHILVGVGCGLLLAGPSVQSHPEIVGLAIVGALLPDLDHERSTIRKVPFLGPLVSTGVRLFSEALSVIRPVPNPYPEMISGSHLIHRGPWHTPVIAILIYVALRLVSVPDLMAQALVWGFVSHLAADTITSMGIAWLWPVYNRVLNATRVEMPIALIALALCVHSVDPGLFSALPLS